MTPPVAQLSQTREARQRLAPTRGKTTTTTHSSAPPADDAGAKHRNGIDIQQGRHSIRQLRQPHTLGGRRPQIARPGSLTGRPGLLAARRDARAAALHPRADARWPTREPALQLGGVWSSTTYTLRLLAPRRGDLARYRRSGPELLSDAHEYTCPVARQSKWGGCLHPTPVRYVPHWCPL